MKTLHGRRRAGKLAARLIAEQVGKFQRAIELALREKGIRWHTYIKFVAELRRWTPMKGKTNAYLYAYAFERMTGAPFSQAQPKPKRKSVVKIIADITA